MGPRRRRAALTPDEVLEYYMAMPGVADHQITGSFMLAIDNY
jgi:hypothetical protein